jgi:hypothetical protein
MHSRHKLGSADTSGYYYQSWQRLNKKIHPFVPDANSNSSNYRITPQIANAKISNSFWDNPKISLKEQINTLKYRTGTVFNKRRATMSHQNPSFPLCPLCGATDSANHFILGCKHPTIQGMITNRHHTAVSMCGQAISVGRLGSSIVSMDACCSEKLLEQDMQIPDDIHRAIPDWLFPDGTRPLVRHQSRPDAVLVYPIPGRASHSDPKQIPAQDRDIHLIELKYCPDTDPSNSLQKAAEQHADTICRLRTRSLRNPERNNRVTLHIILLGVAGTIYNEYTISPLTRLGLTKHKAENLASKLSCHAIHRLTKIINTRHLLHFHGTSGWGVAGGAEAGRRRRICATRSMADNPPDPH